MVTELPTITHKGQKYTFDYRLQELRVMTKKGIKFIALNAQENEMLAYAIDEKDRKLIRANMKNLEWKL